MGAKVGKYQGFVERAERILAEIEQIFLDADHWNRCVRKPSEFPINPDPDGQMAKAKLCLQNFIREAKP